MTGNSSTAPVATTAAQARSRNHQPTAIARPRSARLAGIFMRAAIAGSDASVTVRNAGATHASAPQIQAMTAGNERFWS